VQLEFPAESDIPPTLDKLLAAHTNADILVLSEYTLDGPVPDSLKNWCRINRRYLVVGGKDPAPNNNFYDSAFVVGTNGEVAFRQVKSVPIQFFKDGLPAPEQKVWDSPWGKIGFCVCYDLSYTRVVDRLVKQGAQLIIVPTMDVVDWGVRQHQLHALVAPVRAAEYGVPIFRLASSGISQAVDANGRVLATAPFAGEGKDLFATFDLRLWSSLPIDRFLAPFAVAVTAILVVMLRFGKSKSNGLVSDAGTATIEQARTETANKGELSTTP
jgi:apolipoprotein N-acyltransferase